MTRSGPYSPFVEVALVAVVFEAGVGVARRAARVLPEAGFVEAEALRQIFVAAELPLAGDGGGVAGFLEQVAERGGLRLHAAELDVVAGVRHAGHEADAGGRAEGLNVAAFEAHAGGGEGVEVGRFVGLAAVGAERFVAEVVGHDEDDVWLLRVGGVGKACR